MPGTDHDKDRLYMQRAIELALKGVGHVSPNPLVGAVIEHGGTIIGEAWHERFGEPHAEVNAVNMVLDKNLLPESTLYVNLEPCSHYGKTPPCTDMLIENRIGRVVFANLDSNPLVSGEGASQLKTAGVKVTTGVCEEEGKHLNRRFFTYMEKKRPYLILKWAETADGFMARQDYTSKWISGELARKLVHKWRSEEDAVLVGAMTARKDNPQLNVRDWKGRNPVRVVIDSGLKLDRSLHLFDGSQSTICYNTMLDDESERLRFVKLENEDFLKHLLDDLYNRDLQSVMIEGGAETIRKFIDAGLWDEARVWVGEARFEKGIPAPILPANVISTERVANDELKILVPIKK